MDLTSIALLGMFAAALAGGLIGWLVGWLTRFEVGLAAGLLIFGGVTFWFAGRCYLEYRDFAYAGANGLWGEVIRIEEIPVGDSGSQTAPAVRFSAPDDSVHTVLGPRDHWPVLSRPSSPSTPLMGPSRSSIYLRASRPFGRRRAS